MVSGLTGGLSEYDAVIWGMFRPSRRRRGVDELEEFCSDVTACKFGLNGFAKSGIMMGT